MRHLVVALALAACAGVVPSHTLDAQTKAIERDDYDDVFRKYSKRFFGPGFDWHHFKAQAMAESNLQPNAKSRVGARGLMQLMPSTYKEIKSASSLPMKAINDPESNIAAGILFDRDLYKRWEDHKVEEERLRFTFAGYNAGPGTMLRAKRTARELKLDEYRWKSMEIAAPNVQRWRYKETIGYISTIEQNYAALKALPSRQSAVKRK